MVIVQFHPNYSYEDFVEGYRPQQNGFGIEPGILKVMATKAMSKPTANFVLLLDEINRGNVPKVFGVLLFLLDRYNKTYTKLIKLNFSYNYNTNTYLTLSQC